MASVCIELVFTRCQFKEFCFSTTSLSKCKFIECSFSDSILRSMEIYQSSFKDCTFINSDFSDSDLTETNFDSCYFEKVSFGKVYLMKCNFHNNTFTNQLVPGLAPIICDSEISKNDWSITLKGGFDFYALVEFLIKTQ